jgi:hypothetical protein
LKLLAESENEMQHKKTIVVLIFILVLVISILLSVLDVQTQVTDLFRLNKELQEEGYYMDDFEFKMMGITYWLDHGQY